jgi:hypothetical protein
MSNYTTAPAAPYDEEELDDDEKSDFPNMDQRQSFWNQGQRAPARPSDDREGDDDGPSWD